ncbi:hypothetical protein [Bradyrhizobium sp. CB3481]|nr:hypothetical protein [Bradyrhizobium sp. CB3481]WFU13654.1 hypothetical protein QA643_20600 [Bradyrhizobium sp. CB3481]
MAQNLVAGLVVVALVIIMGLLAYARNMRVLARALAPNLQALRIGRR